MAGADAPNVEVGYAIIALRFEAMRDLADDPIPVPMSSSTAPEVRIRFHDQLAMTSIPTIPITGSNQSQPSKRPTVSPISTNMETAASAITWM